MSETTTTTKQFKIEGKTVSRREFIKKASQMGWFSIPETTSDILEAEERLQEIKAFDIEFLEMCVCACTVFQAENDDSEECFRVTENGVLVSTSSSSCAESVWSQLFSCWKYNLNMQQKLVDSLSKFEFNPLQK